MAIDYKKLAETAKIAREKSIEAGKGEDGGSCNLDAVSLKISRAREENVINALASGGLSAYKTTVWGLPRFLINPPECGQADSRTRACKAIHLVFESAGYNVSMFYMVD
jgi:hypothetical protein